MEKFEIYSPENCYICYDIMGPLTNSLTDVTGFSERPIYQLIESFSISIELSDEIINESGICQSCFNKLNEYEEHLTMAGQIEAELISLMDNKLHAVDLVEPETKIKDEEFEEVEDVQEVMENDEEYETFEEFFTTDQEAESENNAAPDKMHFEITIFDKKDNGYQFVESTSVPATSPKRKRDQDFIVVQMGNNQKVYQCDICSRTFKEKSKLKSHREIHTNERNVICPTCGKRFKTQACLRSHKRVHNHVYLCCDYCGKSYTQKPELLKHMKFVHLQIREFFCDTCGAGFGSKGHLATHNLTHQDESAKKVACQICTMTFHTKAKLERHMKSHTKERDFECGICNKRFLYSYNVTAHIRHVHYREKRKESEQKCSFCGKKFQKKWKLREHLAEAHQVIEALEVSDFYE